MNWFAATGVWGWIIVVLAMMLIAVSIVCALVRVPRIVAIGVLVACALPMLAGVVGMLASRAEADKVLRSLLAPTDEDRRVAAEEAQRCIYVGIGALLVSEMAAVTALYRARKPGEA